MKVNRYGMTQPVFIAMTKTWVKEELNVIDRLVVHEYDNPESVADAEKRLKALRKLLEKTFVERDFDVQGFFLHVESLEKRLTLERAALA